MKVSQISEEDIKKQKNRRKKVLITTIIGIIVTIGIVVGVSYSWWMYTATQESVNTITSDCINLELMDVDNSNIVLENAYPLTDTQAKELKPYAFKITNTCSAGVEYNINLEILETTNRLASEYIAISLDNASKKILNTLEEVETTLNNAVEGRKIETRTLEGGKSKTHYLKLWMDEHVTLEDDVVNKSFKSKIVIEATSKIVEPSTLMARSSSTSTEAFWAYSANITNVVIENNLNPKTNASYTFDVSEKQDGSVMAYLVANESDTSKYTLYLQGKNGITANANSAGLFRDFTNLIAIEGLEYFDTSNVTTMREMFYNCSNLTSLNVSHFDTNNVTDMQYMFYNCSKLTSLNVSHFDTSNVTTMREMFYNCSNLTSLNVSHFDTNNVTDMRWMFYGCSSLTSLDVSNFNTSNVTSMYSMFNKCSSLTSLNLSNFNTNNVTDMQYMFYNCSKLTSLNVSHFDTSNVTTMSYMFSSMPTSATVKVRSTEERTKILNLGTSDRPSSWTTSNVVVAS